MFNTIAYLFVLCGLVSASDKSFFSWTTGVCKNFGIKELDNEKFFNGTWYEQKSYGNWFQADSFCSAFQFQINDKEIRSIYYQYEPWIKSYIYFNGKSDLNNILGSDFDIKFDYLAGIAHATLPMTVVDTDYENYAIIYSCQNYLGFLKSEMAWILTRIRADDRYTDVIKNSANKYGVNYYDFKAQQLQGCDAEEPHL